MSTQYASHKSLPFREVCIRLVLSRMRAMVDHPTNSAYPLHPSSNSKPSWAKHLQLLFIQLARCHDLIILMNSHSSTHTSWKFLLHRAFSHSTHLKIPGAVPIASTLKLFKQGKNSKILLHHANVPRISKNKCSLSSITTLTLMLTQIWDSPTGWYSDAESFVECDTRILGTLCVPIEAVLCEQVHSLAIITAAKLPGTVALQDKETKQPESWRRHILVQLPKELTTVCLNFVCSRGFWRCTYSTHLYTAACTRPSFRASSSTSGTMGSTGDVESPGPLSCDFVDDGMGARWRWSAGPVLFTSGAKRSDKLRREYAPDRRDVGVCELSSAVTFTSSVVKECARHIVNACMTNIDKKLRWTYSMLYNVAGNFLCGQTSCHFGRVVEVYLLVAPGRKQAGERRWRVWEWKRNLRAASAMDYCPLHARCAPLPCPRFQWGRRPTQLASRSTSRARFPSTPLHQPSQLPTLWAYGTLPLIIKALSTTVWEQQNFDIDSIVFPKQHCFWPF